MRNKFHQFIRPQDIQPHQFLQLGTTMSIQYLHLGEEKKVLQKLAEPSSSTSDSKILKISASVMKISISAFPFQNVKDKRYNKVINFANTLLKSMRTFLNNSLFLFIPPPKSRFALVI
ncbi:7726_t:CDS:2 [Funneliformis geosporum]|uniref:7726_t:CDS:1 n=1 Tax=Funneliformis geosporum TaxID=1117311 RepID=A0A9W4ST24_9GLOM|nr:7726_t:CDS:2 [Funneliformis geosporum]